jgi:hypothetical protein
VEQLQLPSRVTVSKLAAGVAVLLALAAALIAAPAASAERTASFGGRTVACQVPSIALSFSPKQVVVSSGGRILVRATRTTRSFSSACQRVPNPRSVVRDNLDSRNGPRGRAACPLARPRITIAVMPVRNGAGRTVGTRVTVWLNNYLTEIAEGMLTRRPWFLYATTTCFPA